MAPPPSGLYRDLPLSGAFDRSYETSEYTPIDGSHRQGRQYSPFVFRVLPPFIVGGDSGNLLAVERRDGSNPRPDYANAIRGVQGVPPSQLSYDRLLTVGGTIPGFAEANTATISHIYSRAKFAQTRPRAPHAEIPAIVGDIVALSTLLQLKRIVNTPPLAMLINPSTMTVSSSKIAQFQERNRYGYIYQAWGDEMTKLSLSFRLGAFASGGMGGNSRGVKRASRNDSASFQQLMSLLTIFHSAGYVHDLEGSRAHYMVGNVSIEYDQRVWVGAIDSFSFGEDETNQNGGLQFEMEFTAVREYDLATSPDSIAPLNNPNTRSGAPRGTLSRGYASGNQLTIFSAPTVGITGTNVPNQPYSDARLTVGDPTPSGVTTRRR